MSTARNGQNCPSIQKSCSMELSELIYLKDKADVSIVNGFSGGNLYPVIDQTFYRYKKTG